MSTIVLGFGTTSTLGGPKIEFGEGRSSDGRDGNGIGEGG